MKCSSSNIITLKEVKDITFFVSFLLLFIQLSLFLFLFFVFSFYWLGQFQFHLIAHAVGHFSVQRKSTDSPMSCKGRVTEMSNEVLLLLN